MNGLFARLFRTVAACSTVAAFSPASAQHTYDSAGVRIYDYRRQNSSRVAFIAADTPHVRVSAYTPDDTGVFSTKAITLLRNGGLAIGVGHSSSMPSPPPNLQDTIRYNGNGSGQVAFTERPQTERPSSVPTPYSMFRTMDVRMFDGAGRFVGKLGKSGTDAGQFSSAPQRISESENGDIVVATIRPTLTRFKPTGEVVSSATFGYGNRGAFNAGTLMDHSIVIGVQQRTVDVDVAPRGTVVRRSEFTYARYDSTGTKISELPIVRNYHYFTGGLGQPSTAQSPWPYSASDQVVAGARNIWRFDPIKWELHNFNSNGKLISITRPEIPARLANAKLGEQFEGAVSNVTVIADDEGNLWMDAGVNRDPTPLNFDVQVWAVYDTTGRQLGTAQLPVGMWLLSVQRSTLLGIYREGPRAKVMVAGFMVKRVENE